MELPDGPYDLAEDKLGVECWLCDGDNPDCPVCEGTGIASEEALEDYYDYPEKEEWDVQVQ